MKIIAIKSSPRKSGNTNTIIEKILEGAEEKGHLALRYDLNEMNFKGCQACRVCKEKDIYCILNDDLKDYWNKLRTADVVILGSPNYMGDISGTLKSFIDRHYCTRDIHMVSRLDPHKKAILVFSQGYEDKEYYKNNYNILEKYLKKHEMDVETIIHSGHDHAQNDEALMSMAYDLGKNL